jgi:hypothetical protein
MKLLDTDKDGKDTNLNPLKPVRRFIKTVDILIVVAAR